MNPPHKIYENLGEPPVCVVCAECHQTIWCPYVPSARVIEKALNEVIKTVSINFPSIGTLQPANFISLLENYNFLWKPVTHERVKAILEMFGRDALPLYNWYFFAYGNRETPLAMRRDLDAIDVMSFQDSSDVEDDWIMLPGGAVVGKISDVKVNMTENPVKKMPDDRLIKQYHFANDLIEGHDFDCDCRDCQYFIVLGEEIRERGLQDEAK